MLLLLVAQDVAHAARKERPFLGRVNVLVSSAPLAGFQVTAYGRFWAFPEAKWGRLGELRAMAWLQAKGLRVDDVAVECRGWDLEVGPLKYEVKTRHAPDGRVHLTRREFEAATAKGDKYRLLVLTAKNELDLETATPQEFGSPAEKPWQTIWVPEYLWTPPPPPSE